MSARSHPYRRNKNKKSQVESVKDHNKMMTLLSRQPTPMQITIQRELTLSGTLSATSGGVLNTIITLIPNNSNWSNWSSLYGTYDEFRVIGARVTLTPLSATTPNMVIVVFDNDDATTALTSYNNGGDYRLKKVFNSYWTTPNPISFTAQRWSVNSDPKSGTAWSTTAAAPGVYPCSFKFYSAGLAGNAAIFDMICELIVELRGPT